MSTIIQEKTTPDPKIILAFFIIYFVWGSTYLANKWAIADMPPFLMAGIRFVFAGVLLYGYCMLIGKKTPTRAQVKNALFAGLFC